MEQSKIDHTGCSAKGPKGIEGKRLTYRRPDRLKRKTQAFLGMAQAQMNVGDKLAVVRD